MVLRPVNVADTPEVHELDGAIGAAVTTIAETDPAVPLHIHPNGLVTPVPADPYGHHARRLASGQVRELTAAERKAFHAGERVTF